MNRKFNACADRLRLGLLSSTAPVPLSRRAVFAPLAALIVGKPGGHGKSIDFILLLTLWNSTKVAPY